MPIIGGPIVLRLQLEDGETDKYIKVILRDESGTEINESPVNLSHKGGGLYMDDSLAFPSDVDAIVAQYIVYEDEDYLIENADYGIEEDIFEKDTSGSAVEEIREIINSLPDGYNLVGEVLSDEE